MLSQNFIYVDSPPSTVETAFEETIKEAKKAAAQNGRSMRKGRLAPHVEYYDNNNDTEMSGMTPIPTTEVL